jgi:uncharacterized membrane protein YbhN (UPF0104 family)
LCPQEGIVNKAILVTRGSYRPLLIALAKYGLGFALLAWVIWQNWHVPSANGTVDLGLAGALHRPIHLGPLALASCIFVVTVLVSFVRWYLLVRAQGLSFTLPNAFRLGLIGFYLSSFLPTSIGGDIIKAACIAREQKRRTVAVATVLIDRAMGLCGLFWLVALIGGIFWCGGYLENLVTSPEARIALETIVGGAIGLTGGSIAFWLLLGVLPRHRAEIFAGRLTRMPRVGHALAEFWRAVWMYRWRGRVIALALLLAIIGQVGLVLTFYFAALTLASPNDIPSLGAHFLLVPVGVTIEAGFPAPGGVGGAEAAYGFLYGLVGAGQAFGVLGTLVKRVIGWAVGLVGYVVYLRMRPTLRPVTIEAAGENPALDNGDFTIVSEQTAV